MLPSSEINGIKATRSTLSTSISLERRMRMDIFGVIQRIYQLYKTCWQSRSVDKGWLNFSSFGLFFYSLVIIHTSPLYNAVYISCLSRLDAQPSLEAGDSCSHVTSHLTYILNKTFLMTPINSGKSVSMFKVTSHYTPSDNETGTNTVSHITHLVDSYFIWVGGTNDKPDTLPLATSDPLADDEENETSELMKSQSIESFVAQLMQGGLVAKDWACAMPSKQASRNPSLRWTRPIQCTFRRLYLC